MGSRFFKIVAFVLALLVADAGVFFAALHLSTIFKPEEWSICQKLPPQDGLILGTSHAEEGLIPQTMAGEMGGQWFNLGRARRNLNFNQYWTHELIKNGQRPKTVVLVVTYHDWNEKSHPYILYPLSISKSRAKVGWELATQRQLWNPRCWFLCDQYSSTIRMMLARSLSWLKNRQTDIPWRDNGARGYLSGYGHMKEAPELISFPKYPLQVLENNRLAFISIIQQWKAVGSQVFVVDAPEYIGSRLSHADYEKEWAMVEQECSILKVPCKSFSQIDDPFLRDITHFRDGGWGYPNSHLSDKGAAEFSKRFIQWVKNSERQ